jgi:hypothetical protein
MMTLADKYEESGWGFGDGDRGAAWAVCKQKQHWAINQMVMMVINVLMNPAAPVAAVAEA